MAEALLSTGAVRVSTLRLAASEPVNSSSDNLESVLPIALDQVARHTHAGRKSCRISSHPLHQCRLGPQKAEARLCGANKTNFGCVNVGTGARAPRLRRSSLGREPGPGRGPGWLVGFCRRSRKATGVQKTLSLIHISEPTRQAEISYAVFCLKKKNK